MKTGSILLLAATAITAQAAPAASSPLPVVIWHGLGDRYDADGLASVGDLVRDIHPGTYVHNIRLADEGKDDQRATFLGNVDAQLSQVCDQLSSDTNLVSNATGVARFDALGFSQGGQLLRGLVERCASVSVRSLVTFGSQHNGINQFGTCGTWDFVCKAAITAAKSNAFGEWAQDNVVPAQYYREAVGGVGTDAYLNASHFLADINNERRDKNHTYKTRLAALDKFVMYVFENDTTAIPKESGWFDEVIEPTDGEERKVIPLRQRSMYSEDWIGLKALDDKDALVFELIEDAKHMQIPDETFIAAIVNYFGPERHATASSLWRWLGRQQPII